MALRDWIQTGMLVSVAGIVSACTMGNDAASSAATGDSSSSVSTSSSSSTDASPSTVNGSSSSSASSSASASSSYSASAAPAPTGNLAIRVQGTQFVDASGNTLQLRGVNVSGLESVAVQGWSVNDPWGGWKPKWAALQSWKVNSVRFPLNEASWLDYQCQDGNGKTIDPDPGKNYKQTLETTIAEANAAGLYVIIDLHWSAPGTLCPEQQNPMADTDNSIPFWTTIAQTFKNNPAVVFELFNEPYLSTSSTGWNTWLSGGTYNKLGNPGSTSATWNVAGMQQMIDAIRGTGATNVILVGGLAYSSDLTGWLTHTPQDPLSQLGATFHTYPSTYPYGDLSPGSQGRAMLASIAATVPLAYTEFGDVDGAGSTVSHAPQVAQYADQTGASYFAWTWNVWGQSENDLILDMDGTPTQGFGVYYQQHTICRAAGTASCQ